MTLIRTYAIGGKICMISTDTKKVLKFFGQTLNLPNEETKIHRISDNFIAAGGGFNAIHEYVIEELKKFSSNSALMITYHLRKISEKVPEEFKLSFKVHPDLFFGIQIIGIDELSKNIFVIGYDMENGVSMDMAFYNQPIANIIAPGDYTPALSRTGKLQLSDPTDVTKIAEDLLHYGMHSHYELIKDFPEEISNTFCYHILALVDDQIMHFEGQVDL